MTESEQELLQCLRALADEGPRQAPDYVRERLLVEFRKRSAHKRRIAWFTAGIGAAAAALLVMLAIPHHSRFPANASPAASIASPADLSSVPADTADAGFYPLPEAEGLPPVEDATVIRVQMPASSLQLMGVALDEEAPTDPVQADILLGQDGLARAVRLVE